jgi:hypothetical protein
MSANLVALSNRIREPQPLDWEEAITIGQQLRHVKELSQFAIGDLANRVGREYGEDSIGKFAYAIGLEKKTVWEYMRVARQFEKSNRIDYLSFRHHQIALRTNNPQATLKEANDKNWTTIDLYKAVKERLNPHPPDVHQHEWVVFRKCAICGEYERIEPEVPGNHQDVVSLASHTVDQSSSGLINHAYLAIRTSS